MIEAEMRCTLFLAGCLMMALVSPSVGVAADLRVFVAGSLRQVLPEIAAEYEKTSHIHVSIVIGQSSKLRKEIENGKNPDIFASAAIEDTAALLKKGTLRSSEILARNELCLMAAPGIKLAPDKLVDLMVDPAIKLGTSTPNADPAGDYAWELFRKIDKVRPGTFAVLDAKALKLLSPRVRRNDTGLPFPEFFRQRIQREQNLVHRAEFVLRDDNWRRAQGQNQIARIEILAERTQQTARAFNQ